MAKKPDTFVPELDGKGRVLCLVDAKTLKRINTKPKNMEFSDKLRAALSKRAERKAKRVTAEGRQAREAKNNRGEPCGPGGLPTELRLSDGLGPTRGTTMDIAALTAFYGWVGWVVVMIPMVVAWWVFGAVSKATYKRLRRSYQHYVLQYWLDRLQKEGKRTFQRPD